VRGLAREIDERLQDEMAEGERDQECYAREERFE
jgi:hypothetical protein